MHTVRRKHPAILAGSPGTMTSEAEVSWGVGSPVCLLASTRPEIAEAKELMETNIQSPHFTDKESRAQ